MSNVKLIPLSGTCDDLASFSHVVLIPTRVDCSPGCRDKILQPCNEVWNCLNPKKGAPYYNPLKAGDKPHLQTQFVDDFNVDPENPVSGLGTYIIASICDITGAVVSTNHALFFSRYFVSYADGKSYQNYEIDIDLIITNFPALTCFSFKFEAKNTDPITVDELCTNHFQIYPAMCRDITMVIESETNNDCCDSVYSLPSVYVGNTPFKYSNAWRFYVELNRKDTEFTKTRFGLRKTTKLELDRLFDLRLTKAIPPYLFAYLTEISIAGERVFIDDVEYYVDEFSFSNNFDTSCDFIGTIPVFQPCTTNFRCT